MNNNISEINNNSKQSLGGVQDTNYNIVDYKDESLEWILNKMMSNAQGYENSIQWSSSSIFNQLINDGSSVYNKMWTLAGSNWDKGGAKTNYADLSSSDKALVDQYVAHFNQVIPGGGPPVPTTTYKQEVLDQLAKGMGAFNTIQQEIQSLIDKLNAVTFPAGSKEETEKQALLNKLEGEQFTYANLITAIQNSDGSQSQIHDILSKFHFTYKDNGKDLVSITYTDASTISSLTQQVNDLVSSSKIVDQNYCDDFKDALQKLQDAYNNLNISSLIQKINDLPPELQNELKGEIDALKQLEKKLSAIFSHTNSIYDLLQKAMQQGSSINDFLAQLQSQYGLAFDDAKKSFTLDGSDLKGQISQFSSLETDFNGKIDPTDANFKKKLASAFTNLNTSDLSGQTALLNKLLTEATTSEEKASVNKLIEDLNKLLNNPIQKTLDDKNAILNCSDLNSLLTKLKADGLDYNFETGKFTVDSTLTSSITSLLSSIQTEKKIIEGGGTSHGQAYYLDWNNAGWGLAQAQWETNPTQYIIDYSKHFASQLKDAGMDSLDLFGLQAKDLINTFLRKGDKSNIFSQMLNGGKYDYNGQSLDMLSMFIKILKDNGIKTEIVIGGQDTGSAGINGSKEQADQLVAKFNEIGISCINTDFENEESMSNIVDKDGNAGSDESFYQELKAQGMHNEFTMGAEDPTPAGGWQQDLGLTEEQVIRSGLFDKIDLMEYSIPGDDRETLQTNQQLLIALLTDLKNKRGFDLNSVKWSMGFQDGEDYENDPGIKATNRGQAMAEELRNFLTLMTQNGLDPNLISSTWFWPVEMNYKGKGCEDKRFQAQMNDITYDEKTKTYDFSNWKPMQLMANAGPEGTNQPENVEEDFYNAYYGSGSQNDLSSQQLDYTTANVQLNQQQQERIEAQKQEQEKQEELLQQILSQYKA